MAARIRPSQLLLIALLSWNAHCYPATKDRSQPGVHYGSARHPVQPSYVNNPAVSFHHEPVVGSKYSSPKTYPASSGPTAHTSSKAPMNNVAPAWDPVEESSTAHSVSRMSQPRPSISLPPPPPPLPFFQAGELQHYEKNFEHGHEERETEELNHGPPPPPPPYPYPGPGFRAGELTHSEMTYNHGNEERETESRGYGGLPPFEVASAPLKVANAPMSKSSLHPVPPPQPPGPSQYYLFLTGQLPPGTFSHFQSEYENGRDHWDEVHYERYHYPSAPVVSTQTHEVPRDAPWQQQPQHYIKS